MKRGLGIVVLMLLASLLHSADYGTCFQAAKDAEEQKDFATAEAQYGEAMNIATDSPQKCNAILGKIRVLRNQKKHREAEKFAMAVVEDEMLKPPESRQILNAVAALLMWTVNRQNDALNLLQQAQALECPQNSNAFFQTYYLISEIYLHRKEPQPAMEAIGNVVNIKGQHPANLYRSHLIMGRAYEQLGNCDEALKHYQTALEYGKKVKYTFSVEMAEKAIQRLCK